MSISHSMSTHNLKDLQRNISLIVSSLNTRTILLMEMIRKVWGILRTN